MLLLCPTRPPVLDEVISPVVAMRGDCPAPKPPAEDIPGVPSAVPKDDSTDDIRTGNYGYCGGDIKAPVSYMAADVLAPFPGDCVMSGGGSGTVVSVGLSAPAEFDVADSPVTVSGTIALAWASQNANLVLASPDGSSGVPLFRSLVLNDLPEVSAYKLLGNPSATSNPPQNIGLASPFIINNDGNLAMSVPASRILANPSTSEDRVVAMALSSDFEFSPQNHTGVFRLARGPGIATTHAFFHGIGFRAITTDDLPALASDRLWGRYSPGAGAVEEVTIGSGLTLSSLGVLEATSTGSGTVTSVGVSAPALMQVTDSPVTSSGTINLDWNLAAARLVGRTTAGSGDAEEISVGTGLSLAAGTLACTVTANPGTVTSVGVSAPALMQVSDSPVTSSGTINLDWNLATARLVGRTTAGTGDAEEISVGAGLSLAAGTLTCTVTANPGTVTSVGVSAPALMQVTDSPVTSSGTINLDWNLATSRLVGRTTAGAGDAEEISVSSPLSLSSGAIGLGTVTEANGGTNQTTYTTGDLLYASESNTLSKRAIGTTDQELVVASGLPTWADRPVKTNGVAYLSSIYTISATDVWYDTGLSITLPSAGTYLFYANVRASVSVSGGNGQINARLYDVTNSAVVTDSERMIFTIGSGTGQNTAAFILVLTVTGSTTIRLEALRTGSASTWTTSQIVTTATGKCCIGYIQIHK